MNFNPDQTVVYYKSSSNGRVYVPIEATVVALEKIRPSMATRIKIKFMVDEKECVRWVSIDTVEKAKVEVTT